MIQKLLRLLPPEAAHKVAKAAMRRHWRAPGPPRSPLVGPEPIRLFPGAPLLHPLGLAAGFDKNGELAGAAWDYGFSWVEVGSVTRLGGPGNPRPRLFRLGHGCLLNRMGLNGDPVEEVAARLAKVADRWYAVNVARSNRPELVGDKAVDDIAYTYSRVCTLGLYVVVNVSCPNESGPGKTFERPEPLRDLLSALRATAGRLAVRPLLVKLSPTVVYDEPAPLESILAVCRAAGVAGVVVGNTLPHYDTRLGRGGLSGGPVVRSLALRCVYQVRQIAPELTVIGCGGVETGDDLKRYLDAGCSAVQAYSGFVVGPHAGPRFAHAVLGRWRQLEQERPTRSAVDA